MSLFAITPAAEKITLDGGKSSVTFTVTNTSGAGLRARATLQADAAQAGWYQLADEPERDMAANGTTEYQVHVAVPKATATGDYRFNLKVVATHNPDETKTISAPVTFHHEAKGKPFPWKLVAAIAGGVLVIGLALFFITRGGGGEAVPDLKGKLIDEARSELQRLDLTIEEELQIGDQPEGTVIDQDPAAGNEIAKGAKVRVTYEASLVDMPRLVGLEIDAAAALIDQHKLAVGVLTEQRQDPTNAGRIVEQKPTAGERVRQGAAIDLVTEAPLRSVPDVKGKPVGEAEAQLRELGLDVAVEIERRSRAQAGKVTSQEPAGQALVQKGATVKLTAEEGRNAVPDVLGKSLAEAKKLIRDAGLKPTTDATELFPASFSFDAGTIGNTRPARGATLLAGDVVHLIPVGEAATVPSGLVGKTQAQAEAAIRAARLQMVVTSQVVPGKPIGVVHSVDPDGGARVLRGSKVRVSVTAKKQIVPKAKDILRESTPAR